MLPRSIALVSWRTDAKVASLVLVQKSAKYGRGVEIGPIKLLADEMINEQLEVGMELCLSGMRLTST